LVLLRGPLLFVSAADASSGLRVGAAAAELEADDSMVIAGGITPGKATGQEGKLRAVALVLEKQPFRKLAIVACDILMITRQHLDPVVAEIQKTTGIPADGVLITCTHTHHAPSTMILHGYGLEDEFTRRVQRAIVKAVQDANANLSKDDCRFFFHLGEEKSVGQNSRMLLEDGQIYWVGRVHFWSAVASAARHRFGLPSSGARPKSKRRRRCALPAHSKGIWLRVCHDAQHAKHIRTRASAAAVRRFGRTALAFQNAAC
jgi:hypothetical protein